MKLLNQNPNETVKPKPKRKPKRLAAPAPKPEVAPTPPAPPPKARPVMSVAEQTYDYLKKYGTSSPLQIATSLNLEPLTVMKTLRELEKQGKIELRASNMESSLKYRMERTLKQTKKRERALKKPFDLTS